MPTGVMNIDKVNDGTTHQTIYDITERSSQNQAEGPT